MHQSNEEKQGESWWEFAVMHCYRGHFKLYFTASGQMKMRVEKRKFTWEFSKLSLLDQTRTRVAWELRSESLHESFPNFHCLIKREQELHESGQARVYMRVFSTFIAWPNENKSCMRVDKREFTWEFSQLSLLDQTRTRVAWELTSESWQARVFVRVLSTFIVWSNENKSCMRVDKREFSWEFSQLSLLDQTWTRVAWELRSESLHESFLNFHCLIKREQELHESWEARVYMRVFSTFIAWSNENKSCMRVDKREFTCEFCQRSLFDQTPVSLYTQWVSARISKLRSTGEVSEPCNSAFIWTLI
jgi:predicted transcriptional regulator